MESLLFLVALLACPLAMAAIGVVGWLWAKATPRDGDRDECPTEDATARGSAAKPSDLATEGA
jgi:hypothetical protein